MLIAGCASASLAVPNIYLTTLLYQNVTLVQDPSQLNPNLSETFAKLVNGTSLEVRTGYFGICTRVHTGDIWVCNKNAAGLARQFTASQDPLNLIWTSAKFKDGIVFSGLIIAAIILAPITLFFLLTFPRWHEEIDEAGSERDVKLFPSRAVLRTALATSTLAMLLMFVSILWQHTASVASTTTAQAMAYGSVKGKVGTTAMALGWAGLALLVIVVIGLALYIWAIKTLDEFLVNRD
ncbi:MAG: hypothetical protein Q9187_005310 [Circinaria calcarea]